MTLVLRTHCKGGTGNLCVYLTVRGDKIASKEENVVLKKGDLCVFACVFVRRNVKNYF